MKHKRNWIIGIVLSTTATFVALQTVSAPEQEQTFPIPPVTFTVVVPATETDTPAPSSPQGCAYVWASYDAPELTQALDSAVKELNPAASGYATQFGEDCIATDGTSTFGVMETDFTVRLPVDDLSREEDFGNWVAQVMEFVAQIPREEIPGATYGFVEFWFEKSETERIVFRVPIQEYSNGAQGRSGVELFRMFYTPP